MQTSDSKTRRKTTSLLEEHSKKHKESDENKVVEFPFLIPGLPNDLAQRCLSNLHPNILHGVCQSWRRLIYSPSFPPFFSLYALLSPRSSNMEIPSVEFSCLDPFSSTWRSLPKPPLDTSSQLLHHHPSFINRNFPIQSLTVSRRLILIAATNQKLLPSLTSPLCFDPLTKSWFSGPPLPNPRRWCVTGSVNGEVYVGSGMGSSYKSNVAKSLEKWNIKGKKTEWIWEKIASYNDLRFSREAIEAVGLRGKLYMVNTKGNTLKEGISLNVQTNQWEKMPPGMLAGWRGPAAADEDKEIMYMVDESKGALRKYDFDSDSWEDLIMSMDNLKGAEQIGVGRGRVCVVCGGGGERIVVVDVVATPPRICVVNPPQDMEVVAVHILPRMSQSEDYL